MSDTAIEMTDAELMDRLRAIARQRQQQPLEPFRIPLETHSEWIAADRIASLLQEAADRLEQNEIGEALAKALLAAEERGAKTERAAWTECTKDLGPLLTKAKADGVLDTLIEANIWPLPATCITDADVLHSIEVAIAIRPGIEAEQIAKDAQKKI